MKTVTIYMNGTCSGSSRAGGYGAILTYNGREKEISGHETNTTNIRMELMAAIAALEALKEPCKVEMFSGSSHIVKGANEWIKGWLANGWKNSRKKVVMNADLWQRLLFAARTHRVTIARTKGHAGCPINKRANALARIATAGAASIN